MPAIWRFLNGEVPGGFTVLLVVTLSFLIVWRHVYRVGVTLPKPTYRRWRWRAPILFLIGYFLFWIQSPPKTEPMRLAVLSADQAGEQAWLSRGLADLTARRLVRTLPHEAIINPWMGSTDYLPPAADVLAQADYHVYNISGEYSTQPSRAKVTIGTSKGTRQIFAAAGPALVDLSAHLAEWILSDLGKKTNLAAPFAGAHPAKSLEFLYHGDDLLEEGKVDSAQRCAMQAYLADSALAPVLLLLASCQELKQQRELALATLVMAVRADSASLESLLALGEFSLRHFDWNNAEAAFKVVLSRAPCSTRALAGLAQIHPERLKDLRLKTPRALLEEALRLDPTFENARILLADHMTDQTHQSSARNILMAGLELNPTSENLLFKLGAVELGLGHPESARDAYQQILQIKPLNALAFFNLGVVDYRTQQYDQAIKRFEAVQGLNGPVDCYYYLGLIYRQKGDQSRAKFYFQRRWELRSNDKDDFGLKARDLAAELDAQSGG